MNKFEQKHFQSHQCPEGHNGVDDWHFNVFEQCETYNYLKEKKIFWKQWGEISCLLGVKEKEYYKYKHTKYKTINF